LRNHSNHEEILSLPKILRKVYYRVHNSPSLVPILGQLTPVITSHFIALECFFNIILSYMPRSPIWSVLFTYHRQLQNQSSCSLYAQRHPPIDRLRSVTLAQLDAKLRECASSRHSSLCIYTHRPCVE
jgi:hypothetical protein